MNLPKRKDGAYVLNLHEYKSIGTHCIALYLNGNNTIYFDSFGAKYILKDNNIKNITNIYRIQAHDLIICRYFCIKCTDFVLEG